MAAVRSTFLIAALTVAGITTVGGQQASRPDPGRLQLEPLGIRNEAVFPYFEGWTNNDDGTATILLGYYNRNTDQTLEVPIGPNNRVEPGGPDRGQPTYFLPRRQWGVFSITVPKDSTQKFTWTLTANNFTNSVTVWLNPKYYVEPFKNIANGNTPPRIKLTEAGEALQGPPRAIAQSLQAVVNQPLTLDAWASDLPATYDAATNKFLTLEEVAAKQAKEGAERSEIPRPTGARAAGTGRGDQPAETGNVAIINGQVIPMSGAGRGAIAASSRAGAGVPPGPPSDVTLVWTKYRGPGEVTFSEQRLPVRLKGQFTTFQKATTTATFAAPGEYLLRLVANDASGDGGGADQCCWTTAHVRVTVK